MSLRRHSKGFSRGTSKYRGVTRHQKVTTHPAAGRKADTLPRTRLCCELLERGIRHTAASRRRARRRGAAYSNVLRVKPHYDDSYLIPKG